MNFVTSEMFLVSTKGELVTKFAEIIATIIFIQNLFHIASKDFATCFLKITGSTKPQLRQFAECPQQISPTVSTLVTELFN